MRALPIVLATFVLTAPAAAQAGPGDDYRALSAALDAWRPEKARPIYEAMRRRDAADPLTLLAAARLRFETGDYAGAEAAWEQLVAAAGELPAYADLGALIRRTRAATAGMSAQRSRRFEVWTTDGPDRMLAPFVLDTLERGLDALIADLGIEIPAEALPLRVEVYPDVTRFVEVSTLSRKEVETSGTVALCKFNRMMIVSPRRMARGYRWRDTLTHELVHFVLSRSTDNRLPLWLHEGIAKFEERRWNSPEVGRLHPIQSSILAEAAQRNVWIPFSDMMPSLAKLDSGWKTALAFAEVTLLISHIVEDGGMPALRRVIRGFAESPAAGYAALGVAGEAEMWQHFKARAAATTFEAVPGYRFIPPSVAEDESAAEPEPIGEARARKHSRLGDLLRDEGRWQAAMTEYTRAEEVLGYRPAPLGLRRAEALMIGGLYLDAERELLELLNRDPDRATAHWLLGRIALFRKEPAAALRRFETAFGIAPFHDEVLDGLAESARRLGDEDSLRRWTTAREVWHAARNR